ncbi:MAG: flippase [Candidatus Woesearchaeota archaeon]
MSLFKGTAAIIGSMAVIVLSGFVINFILGRHFGPELYGVFGVLIAFWNLITLLLTTGFMQATSQKIASNEAIAHTIKNKSLQLQLIISSGFCIIFFFAAPFIAGILNEPDLSTYLRLLIPGIIIYSITSAYSGYLLGKRMFGRQAVLLAIYGAGRLFILTGLGYLFFIKGAVYGLIAASFFTMAYGWLMTRGSDTGKFSPMNLLRFGIPATLFAAIFIGVMSIDLLFVKALLASAEAGYYAAASTLAKLPYLLFSGLAMTILPEVARLHASEPIHELQKTVREAMRLALMIIAPIGAAISGTASLFLILLYSSEYAPGGKPLVILIAGTSLLSITYVLAAVINGIGKPKISTIIITVSLAASAAFNLLLIPQYGIMGAAIATTLAGALSLVLATGYIFVKIKTLVSTVSVLRIALATVVMWLISCIIPITNKFMLPLEYAAMGAAYVAVLVLTKELGMKDIERFRRIFERQKPS